MKLPTFRSPGPTLWGIGVFLIILAVSAPWIPVFLLTLFIGLLISATLAYSLNLITGLTGYVSFGHVVFMAFGGYALAFGVGTLKLFAYALSGLFAGAAGGVYAWNVSGAFPYDAFNLVFSLRMLAMIVIGGMGTLLGPLLGAIAVYIPSQIFLTVLIGFEYIIIGLVVVVIALFVPEGIVGTLRQYIPELRGILE